MSDIEKLVEIIEKKVALQNEVDILKPQLKNALEEQEKYKNGLSYALEVLRSVESMPIGLRERQAIRERIEVVKSFLEG